eukprot:2975030-Alexandrium_andersonii.AAC.1
MLGKRDASPFPPEPPTPAVLKKLRLTEAEQHQQQQQRTSTSSSSWQAAPKQEATEPAGFGDGMHWAPWNCAICRKCLGFNDDVMAVFVRCASLQCSCAKHQHSHVQDARARTLTSIVAGDTSFKAVWAQVMICKQYKVQAAARLPVRCLPAEGELRMLRRH